MKISRFRITLAFFLAPLLPAYLLNGLTLDSGYGLLTLVMVYVPVLIIGTPIFLQLKNRNGLKLVPIIFAGLVVGALFGAVLSFWDVPSNMSVAGESLVYDGNLRPAAILFFLKGIGQLALLGLVTAFLWWLIGVAPYNKAQNSTPNSTLFGSLRALRSGAGYPYR